MFLIYRSLSEEGIDSLLEGNNYNQQQATQEILNVSLKLK